MAHASNPQPLSIIDVDLQGRSSAGEEFELIVDDEYVEAGYFMNQPVALRFPDGSTRIGNRVLVSDAGVDMVAEELASPDVRKLWVSLKEERSHRRAVLEAYISEPNVSADQVEILWLEMYHVAKKHGKTLEKSWDEVVANFVGREPQLAWYREVLRILDAASSDPKKAPEYIRKDEGAARAALAAERSRIEELKAADGSAAISFKFNQIVAAARGSGVEAEMVALLGEGPGDALAA